MKAKPKQKYYWGIGLENETYMQFEESILVSGAFIPSLMLPNGEANRAHHRALAGEHNREQR